MWPNLIKTLLKGSKEKTPPMPKFSALNWKALKSFGTLRKFLPFPGKIV